MAGDDDSSIRHYRSLLRSCALGRSPPPVGPKIHAHLQKSGLLLSAAVFHFYAAAGPLSAASRAFLEIPPISRSAADFTALASLLSPLAALRLFRSMLRSGVPLDSPALVPSLSTAAKLSLPVAGAAAHLVAVKLGLPLPFNPAIHFYASCGLMADARRLFGEMETTHVINVVSWTILLTGVVQWEGINSGREVFDRMPERNEISYTVMIKAYVEAGLPRHAMLLLEQMLFGGVSIGKLNHISLLSLLSACSQAGDLTVGRWIHTHVVKMVCLEGGVLDRQRILKVGTALIDMYAKCGRIGAARKMFDTMRERNLVAWNVMLSGLSMHGLGAEVLSLFSQMMVISNAADADDVVAVVPDDITFVAVLSACSRSGLVEQGRKLFCEIEPVYGLTPKIEHYACMVDLLSRVGRVEEAEALVREMPMRPNEVVLGSLMAACGIYGKLELGRSLLQELLNIDPDNTDYHVLLSNMHSSHGRHDEADDLWNSIKISNKIGNKRKGPGLSFIEIGGYVHRFCAGDRSHPQTRVIYEMLEEMMRRLRLAGYAPAAASSSSRMISRGVVSDEEEGEQALLSHSERLAISFGLISTKPGVSLRIFKNLRICFDCHCTVKLISDIFKREIVIRDRNRFHCFKEGMCSCSDYW